MSRCDLATSRRCTVSYYRNVTGEPDKAAQTYQEQIESYPRECRAYLNLGFVFALQGQYERATEIARQLYALLRIG